jgi:hypothetical protein
MGGQDLEPRQALPKRAVASCPAVLRPETPGGMTYVKRLSRYRHHYIWMATYLIR